MEGVFLLAESDGFLLARVVADEAEILTLAVDPTRRRRGAASRLLAAFGAEARARGAATAFLEVAADNEAALALYAGAGFLRRARRKGYYKVPGRQPVDAEILSMALR
ncbi:MAG: GNAT family N-acetyltransferase [Rhodobacteraceae bacterium]|nr:GNAT family N-acetyltransferase [Paracoccaceae bacterium]